MGDSLNIQNMLETGYFNTSRARTTGTPEPSSRTPMLRPSTPSGQVAATVSDHAQPPRDVHDALSPEPRRWHPPPAFVEDEAQSLAREHGASVISDDVPPVKGDINASILMEEVREEKPETGFILVPGSAPRSTPSPKGTTKPEKRDHVQPSKDSKDTKDPKDPRDPRDQRDHRDPRDLKDSRDPRGHNSNRRSPRLDDEHRQREYGDRPRYGQDRRRSQQDLPAIDTGVDDRRHPEHHRTRSAASGPRPDYFDSRHPRGYGDSLLSPDVVHAGPKGREKRYHGRQSSGDYARRSPPNVGYRFDASRDSDRDYHGRDRASSSAKRSSTDLGNGRPRRRMTNDAENFRYRDDYSYPRNDRREPPSYGGRSEGSKVRPSPRSSREPSHSGDEYSRSPRSSGYPALKPVVLQEDRFPARQERTDDNAERVRPSSRTSTFPLMAGTAAAAAATGAAAQMAVHDAPKDTPSQTVPVPKTPQTPQTSQRPRTPQSTTETPRTSNTLLPYPDDDFPPGLGLGIQGSSADAGTAVLCMPEPSSAVASTAARFPDSDEDALATPSTVPATPQAWQPPAFDPEKDGLHAQGPVGSVRRPSESHEVDESDNLPECPRQKPVAGMMDWLTLPHTNFNICPTCYTSVFSATSHRAFFKPMLRPLDEPIACDFGVSPWYRIAWLLTIKDDVPDMRLLQQLATNSSASSRDPCPGSKKATRTWLTVKDPHTRQPVTDFSVCYQCARSVEMLLPNLTGVFVPIDMRPKPDVCSLHFTRDRKQFVLFFDAMETTSDKALAAKQPPNVDDLARELWKLTVGSKCREDSPITDGYWHSMQFLPQFTVCGNCFESVVKPKLGDGNVIARNFYMKAQRLPTATCQLYSTRMREIFKRACRRNDPKYLEEKVIQRRRIEKDIYDKLVKLDRANVSTFWKEEQVEKLVEEWKRWE